MPSLKDVMYELERCQLGLMPLQRFSGKEIEEKAQLMVEELVGVSDALLARAMTRHRQVSRYVPTSADILRAIETLEPEEPHRPVTAMPAMTPERLERNRNFGQLVCAAVRGDPQARAELARRRANLPSARAGMNR